MKMNSVMILKYAVLLVCTICTSVVRASTTSYNQIIAERERVLSEILVYHERSRASGTANEDLIAAAKLKLYSFRRDIAATLSERIKNQELIVRIFEEKLQLIMHQRDAGLAGSIQILEVEALLLEAKQALEELRMVKK